MAATRPSASPPVSAPPVRASRWAAFSALRYPTYRQYWIGLLIAITGWQVQMVAQGWLVYQMTGSPAALGFAGLLQAVPTVVLGLFGGVLADRFDRRRLLMFTQSGVGLLVLVEAILVATGLIELWHIYLLAPLLGAVWAFDQPARMALIPHLVPREALMNAVATGSVVWQASAVAGPGIAGVLIAQVGIAPCFFLTTAGMLFMVFSLARLPVPAVIAPRDGRSVAQNLAEGLRFIGVSPLFRSLIAVTWINAILGMSYMQMMPVFARDVLTIEADGYGLLMGVGGAGAFIGTVIVASLGSVERRGLLLLGTGAAFGALLVVFAFSRWVPLSAAALFVMGCLTSIYMTSVNTTLQAFVPDHLRGRVMGVYGMTWSMVPLGGMLQGGVASILSAPIAVGMGGLLVVAVFAATLAMSAQLRGLRSETASAATA